MPEQDADVLEILIGQMAEIREINAVLSEALGVVAQPEFIQPFSDRLQYFYPSPALDESLSDVREGTSRNHLVGCRRAGVSWTTNAITRRAGPACEISQADRRGKPRYWAAGSGGWHQRPTPSRRGSTGSSPLTDPVVQNYRSGFLRYDSPRQPKVV